MLFLTCVVPCFPLDRLFTRLPSGELVPASRSTRETSPEEIRQEMQDRLEQRFGQKLKALEASDGAV